MSRLLVLPLIFIALIVSWPACSATPSTNHFITIALGQEYSKGLSVLRRWEKPIVVQIHHVRRVPAQVLSLVDEHLSLLTQATQHSIRRANQDANVDLYIVTQQTVRSTWQRVAEGRFPSDALCAAQIKTRKGGSIESAVILIPVDTATSRGRLLSCFVEELTQITGLVNDSDEVYPSIFNDRSTNQMITPQDWILLRTLYDAALRPGMSASEVRRKVPDILQRLVADGELDRATQLLRRSELHELLNSN